MRPAPAAPSDADQPAEAVAAAGTEEVVPAADQAAVLCFRKLGVRSPGCRVHPDGGLVSAYRVWLVAVSRYPAAAGDEAGVMRARQPSEGR
jgi:hypothetical protein